MIKIAYLDAKRFYRGIIAGGMEVIRHQAYLNKINVFPVADADTGINLAGTMQAIKEGSRPGRTLKETLGSVAESALMGARGNSGIIFAQYLHGLSVELPEQGMLTAKHFAESAQRAVKLLYKSIMNPVEGTMLTVIREWADSLGTPSEKSADFLHLLTHSLGEAKRSLEATPSKLKALAEAGVVDAGASGFVYFLEGVVNYIHKGSLRDLGGTNHPEQTIPQTLVHSTAPGEYRYCFELILQDCSLGMDSLREKLAPWGDSIILAGSQSKLHVHIHCNKPDIVYQSMLLAGRVKSVKVDDMLRQYQVSNTEHSSIGIISDSACDLPAELLDKYRIGRIPFGISFGEQQFLDGITITPDAFYRKLLKDAKHPLSSQPSPKQVGDLLDFYTKHHDHCFGIFISEHLSGVYSTALSLAANFPVGKLSIVNSRQLSVSQGLVTLRFARAVEAGLSREEIAAQSEAWIANTKIYTDINTLRYMVRGGRVKPLTGMLAALLNLKPIVSLDASGKAKAMGKSFSRRSNMKKIVQLIRSEMADKQVWEYAIVHAMAPDRATRYAELLTQLIGKKPAYIMPLAPVVGVHNGIGAVGIGVSYNEL